MDVQAVVAAYDLQMVYESIASRTRVLLDCVSRERENYGFFQRQTSACSPRFFGWFFLHTTPAMLLFFNDESYHSGKQKARVAEWSMPL